MIRVINENINASLDENKKVIIPGHLIDKSEFILFNVVNKIFFSLGKEN